MVSAYLPSSTCQCPDTASGGGIERWEDPTFRKCFEDLLSGDWRDHDPYDLENRINARSSMYGRVGQVSRVLGVVKCISYPSISARPLSSGHTKDGLPSGESLVN